MWEDVTEEMYAFIEKEMGLSKEYLLANETQEVWEKVVDFIFDIEIEAVLESDDIPISPRGTMAASIVNAITISPDEDPNFIAPTEDDLS